jgi:hypothetical protein
MPAAALLISMSVKLLAAPESKPYARMNWEKRQYFSTFRPPRADLFRGSVRGAGQSQP